MPSLIVCRYTPNPVYTPSGLKRSHREHADGVESIQEEQPSAEASETHRSYYNARHKRTQHRALKPREPDLERGLTLFRALEQLRNLAK
jgi:hypothetical protein